MLKTLKRELWVKKGICNHNFDEKDLDRVILNLGKLDMVPKGYLYPELQKINQQMPDILQEMLTRKANH